MEVRLSQGLVTEDQDHTRLPLIRSILLGVRQELQPRVELQLRVDLQLRVELQLRHRVQA